MECAHDNGSISNCSIWTNITGTWAETAVNTSTSNIVNGSLGFSHISTTLGVDALFNWAVGCYNATTSDGSEYLNFTSNRSLIVDATPPGTISLNSPADLFNQTSSIMTFGFTAIDVRLQKCNVNISAGGQPFTSIPDINTTSGVLQVNGTVLSNGTYSWNVNCSDEVGNTNTSASRTFTIDQIPPVFVNLSNSTADSVIGTEEVVAIGVNVSDNLTGVSTVRLFVNISGVSNNEVNITRSVNNYQSVNLTYKIPVDQLNQHLNFTFEANDSLGNKIISSTMVFVVGEDRTKPDPYIECTGRFIQPDKCYNDF